MRSGSHCGTAALWLIRMVGHTSDSNGVAEVCPRASDTLNLMADRELRDVGGTPGGLVSFLVGFAMVCVGGYLLTNQVSVAGSYWSFYGGSTFGITLIPMLIGIGLLFYNGRSIVGWLLTIAGALFILAGVLANLHIYFQPTSLFNTIVMLVLLVGGLGLIARSLRPQRIKSESPQPH